MSLKKRFSSQPSFDKQSATCYNGLMDLAGTHNTDLTTPIQFAKGVGPSKAKTFAGLGVHTMGDLLEYFPRSYSFLPEPIKIKDLHPNETACIVGIVEQTEVLEYRKPRMFKLMIADETGILPITFFNATYLKDQIEPGNIIAFSGKATIYKHKLQMNSPKFAILSEEQSADPSALGGPTYPASAKLSSRQIRRVIHPLIDELIEYVTEFYDEPFRKKTELIERTDAYRWIHDPGDEEQLALARRRLKYDELFLMQLGLAIKRHQLRHSCPATAMRTSDQIDSRIRKRFPFLLTEDQTTVIEEIVGDMESTTPMNRLLQGDVGSGKTVVALYAALLAVANKTQAAIMAPTEILATQHLLSIEKFLKGSQVKTALITGKLPAGERREIIEGTKSGEINILVGTVALLNENIDFNDLGVVIIDEQHKFGVHQRGKLRKATAPHCLVMTATPIPRTLAMTAFGDLDVSIIKHAPPGRGKVVTRHVKPHDRTKAYEFIRQRLRAKKQAFFVYPRIDNEDETSDIKSATQEHANLSRNVFSEFTVALLHGQMSSAEKKEVMQSFRDGRTDILVSTVVIEVGVDVPNATIMVVEHADHFGLAQLHQLRGRIGRGQSNSYCFLFADTENEIAISRLDVMTRSNDGFEIAEHDLKLRGPGELFSTRQHGLDDLKIANIIEDFDLLTLARKNAFDMVRQDPLLKNPQNQNIKNTLIQKLGEKLGLVDIA